MNIDLMEIFYTASMVILAFMAAMVVTKTLSKYFKLNEKEDKEEKSEETEVKP